MMTRFLLVCEGNSDAPLAFHIQRLLAGYGHPPPGFDTSWSGRRLVDKIRRGLEPATRYDLLFVHRDADQAGPDARYREIENAVDEAGFAGPWVGIVPVRMMEAWLILDEATIRRSAGNPRGRVDLDLPSPIDTERMRDPKSALSESLLTAGAVQGRKRRDLRRRLPVLRNELLENLPAGGPLERVSSWARFRDDTVAALRRVGG